LAVASVESAPGVTKDKPLQAVIDAHGVDAHGVRRFSAQPHGLG